MITFDKITAPVYDSTGSYQATGSALSSNAIRRFIDTNSYSTQHYAFLTGSDGGGAIGIAYLGTCCFRNSNGKLGHKAIYPTYIYFHDHYTYLKALKCYFPKINVTRLP